MLHRPLDGKRAVMTDRDGGFLLPQKVFNGHLPSFLATTCLAFHLLTKVFATSHRQVVSNWNCLRSNYRTCGEKKQGRQVFSQVQFDAKGLGKLQKQILKSKFSLCDYAARKPHIIRLCCKKSQYESIQVRSAHRRLSLDRHALGV